MDPKALDHLDPKQKEAYDRIMGHAEGTSDLSANLTASTAEPSAPSDLSAPIDSFSSTPMEPETANPLTTEPATSDFNSSPLDTPLDATAGDQPQFYTPGQESSSTNEPSLTADPNQLSDQLTNSPFASSSFNPTETDPSANAATDNLAPPNASFFSNPSPSETMPPTDTHESLDAPLSAEPEGIPASSPDNFTPGPPVTPYTASEVPNLAPASGAFTQPLPSPASVPHEQPKEATPLIRVLYILGAVVFFAVYTIFWIKVFNLPFLF